MNIGSTKRWYLAGSAVLLLVLTLWHFRWGTPHEFFRARTVQPSHGAGDSPANSGDSPSRSEDKPPLIVLNDSLRAGEQYSARRIGGIFRMAESLRLSAEEFDTLCSRYALMRTEIAQLEIAKARATRIGGSTVRIFIPSYPEEGSRIRQEWDSFMTETLGKDRAKAFALEIPGALEARTANFGAASQEYTVTAIKDAAGGSRLFITKFVTTLSQDQPSPDGVRESLSTLDCDISETDGGELSVLRPFTEGLVAVSSEEERRLYHP